MEFYERTCVADIADHCCGLDSLVLYQPGVAEGDTTQRGGGEVFSFSFCEFFIDYCIHHVCGGSYCQVISNQVKILIFSRLFAGVEIVNPLTYKLCQMTVK